MTMMCEDVKIRRCEPVRMMCGHEKLRCVDEDVMMIFGYVEPINDQA